MRKRSTILQAGNGSAQNVIGNRNAELGELPDVRIDFLFSVELIVVVSAEVFKLMSAEDKKDCDEHGMRNGHCGAIFTAMRNQP